VPDADEAAAGAEMGQMVLNGIDAGVIGKRVLEAVKAGELYIFTHPEMKAFAAARFNSILAAFDSAASSEALKSG
jgi:hypothetical protein